MTAPSSPILHRYEAVPSRSATTLFPAYVCVGCGRQQRGHGEGLGPCPEPEKITAWIAGIGDRQLAALRAEYPRLRRVERLALIECWVGIGAYGASVSRAGFLGAEAVPWAAIQGTLTDGRTVVGFAREAVAAARPKFLGHVLLGEAWIEAFGPRSRRPADQLAAEAAALAPEWAQWRMP